MFHKYIFIYYRTARGDNKGTALSFIAVKEMKLLEQVEKEFSESSETGETMFKPYQFRMEEIEGFRYRAKVGQGSHRLEKYLNIQHCLEKSLKIKFALKST